MLRLVSISAKEATMIYQVLLLLVGAAQCYAQCSCSCGDLRLTNVGSSENDGNVEVCWNGKWLAVRYSSSSIVAGLICQQLGFSVKDYQMSASTVRGYTNSIKFVCDQESCCDGEEITLRTCDRVMSYIYAIRFQQLRIHCVEHSNDTIPDIVSVTNMEGAAVSLKWRLVERDELGNFMIECSSVNHVAHLLVNNQTFIAQLNILLPHTDYNCCVSALYIGYKTQSCVSISTQDITASSGSASVRNADTVGGVLGFIIIILLLLLILAIVALVYPCLIRPRIINYRTLSRLSDFLDRKVYNNVYGTSMTASAKSSSEEESGQRSARSSSDVSTISANRRITAVNKSAESVPTQYSDAAQAYEPLNYYSPVQTLAILTVTNTTDAPRVYEPAAYTLPSTCLGQVSDTDDHVYAVLEEQIN